MSPNSLVDNQMLVVFVQNTYKIKLGNLELLELTFGAVDPISFTNHQVDVLVNPSFDFVTSFTGTFYPFMLKQCWSYRASFWCIEAWVAPNVRSLSPL